jgi:site-specific DNA-adenine methylase
MKEIKNMTSQELSDIVREWVKADEHRTILFYASNGKEYTTDVLINNKGEFTSYLIDLAKKSEDVRKEIIDAAKFLENENHTEND